jgi:hypothetical protein
MPALPIMIPPVGKSGPFKIPLCRQLGVGVFDDADAGVYGSLRLCGGMFVVMPTAMRRNRSPKGRKAGGEDQGLPLAVVIVGNIVYGFLFYVRSISLAILAMRASVYL